MDAAFATTAEACHNNPGFQIMQLRCPVNSNQNIYIQSVSVGKAWTKCDDYFCVYETLEPEHRYFINLTNKCDGKSQCSISATDLANISKMEPYIFAECGNNTPLYNDRNKVLVDYICSGEFGTVHIVYD